MTTLDDFSKLLARVRQGDSDAARELVGRYESAIRVAVRTRLSGPRLRRQFDSLDVCQSVLASFFIHVAAGAYDLHEPRQLLGLLTKMARNKLAMHARGQFRQRRDVRRVSALAVDDAEVASNEPGPIRRASGKELLGRALDMMSPEVRAMAACRMQGELWPQIAVTLGGTPEARRKQFERAVARIADSLEVGSLEG
jgi:DNA-directed RNA polymerase specialized sigma24 family protein